MTFTSIILSSFQKEIRKNPNKIMIHLFQIIFFYEIQFFTVATLDNNRLVARNSLSSSIAKSPEEFTPYFSKPIENATAVLGRSAVLECSVENLGPYNKVAWLKMDSSNSESTVLTIGTDTLFGERKYRVTQNGDRQWFLHIKHVRVSDRGNYMCQVNAKNMISQVGHLDVQVPPILIEDRTSPDTTVDEHQKAILKCTAKGYPKPKISWRREDGQPINLGLFGGQRYSVQTFEGSQLNLTQVTREDMGAYLCIASNGVPPSLSRRILLHVNFRPKIRVQNQLISSHVGAQIELICMCEAYPRPMVTWITPSEIPVVVGSSNNNNNNNNSPSSLNQTSIVNNKKRYEAKEEYQGYRVTMRLTINYLTKEDFGSFKCLAKNTLGEKEGLIRVYENQSKNDLPIRRLNNVNASKNRRKESSSTTTTKNDARLQQSNIDGDNDEDDEDEDDENFHHNFDLMNKGKYYDQSVQLSNGILSIHSVSVDIRTLFTTFSLIIWPSIINKLLTFIQ